MRLTTTDVAVLGIETPSGDEAERTLDLRSTLSGDVWALNELGQSQRLLRTNAHGRVLSSVPVNSRRSITRFDVDAEGRVRCIANGSNDIFDVSMTTGALTPSPFGAMDSQPLSLKSDGETLLVGVSRPPGVWRIDSQGHRTVVGLLAEGSEPRDLAVAQGEVFVADSGRHRVVAFNGTKVRTVLTGSDVVELCHPWSLAISDQNDLMICDTRNHRIVTVSSDGRSASWGTPDDVDAGLFNPRSVVWTDVGSLVADSGNFRIVRMDDGNVVRRFGPSSRRTLSYPRSVHLARHGLLVSDTYNNRLVWLTPPTRLRVDSRAEGLWWPRSSSWSQRGLLVADGRNDRVLTISEDGGSASEILGLSDPHHADWIGNHHIAVVDTGHNKLRTFKRGTESHHWLSDLALELSDPHHLHLNRERAVVSDTGNHRVLEVDRRGIRRVVSSVNFGGTDSPLKEPRAAAIQHGLLWILDSGNGRVVAVDEQCEVVWSWDGSVPRSPSPNVYGPRWMTWINANTLVVSDYFGCRLVALTVDIG